TIAATGSDKSNGSDKVTEPSGETVAGMLLSVVLIPMTLLRFACGVDALYFFMKVGS
ncbi:MAG: hypothetical protein GXP30_05495, partial [Verrucomicrobia bacterium]|nr:hypothetical protein [Verrucomicrobiota bacterium]